MIWVSLNLAQASSGTSLQPPILCDDGLVNLRPHAGAGGPACPTQGLFWLRPVIAMAAPSLMPLLCRCTATCWRL